MYVAKAAAKKRATVALFVLCDIVFQRQGGIQQIVVGRIPEHSKIIDKAFKLVGNVLYSGPAIFLRWLSIWQVRSWSK